MQNGDTWFRTKEITKYDYVPYAPEEKRRKVLERSVRASNKALLVKGKHYVMYRWYIGNKPLQENI